MKRINFFKGDRREDSLPLQLTEIVFRRSKPCRFHAAILLIPSYKAVIFTFKVLSPFIIPFSGRFRFTAAFQTPLQFLRRIC